MSTNQRYGTIVWNAVCQFDSQCQVKGTTYWFTTSDIAVIGEVSVPTVRKYLQALVEQGFVARAGTKKMPIYALVKSV